MIDRIVRPALLYWALIFGLGFALGTARVLWFGPRFGEEAVVLVEVPLMVLASSLAARWITHRYTLRGTGETLAMGALAFAVLMAAELTLTAALPGESPRDWLHSLVQMPGVLGFAGQVLFGLMPWLTRPRHPIPGL
ncbi:hypothetical protein GRI94_19330 [Erythrobacter jejuensis]|uniref:Uncharacterized protein n=1 Tax=Parerythrobacter jejuensis TaxID=795812 RepID=A0A845AP46_9SPHN|nr:hypothetical protein [Parerythrobacter jejuensis]MXP33989.1 hypothetical protein [Parerythrobacter jejuensis]